MPPGDMEDAEADMAEQERWGMNRSDMALLRIVRLVKLARGKLADLEARIQALEGK